mmetsp:Transcript_146055/g.468422  ORF Transcript_146055/g.468422 Transcript_146055/m.468422 type:complete len:202 (-) Transcript_146055:980-1585(-)
MVQGHRRRAVHHRRLEAGGEAAAADLRHHRTVVLRAVLAAALLVRDHPHAVALVELVTPDRQGEGHAGHRAQFRHLLRVGALRQQEPDLGAELVVRGTGLPGGVIEAVRASVHTARAPANTVPKAPEDSDLEDAQRSGFFPLNHFGCLDFSRRPQAAANATSQAPFREAHVHAGGAVDGGADQRERERLSLDRLVPDPLRP